MARKNNDNFDARMGIPGGGLDGSSSYYGRSSSQSQHAVGVVSTPSTPSKPTIYNPYSKQQSCTPRNPYKTSASVVSTPSSTLSTPVRNPYLKKAASSLAATSCSSAKRTLNFSDEAEEVTPPFKRKHSSTSSSSAQAPNITINLNDDFSQSPSVDIDLNRTYTLFFDGGSRGNPGIAGAGMVLYDGSKEIWSGREYLGDGKTNNEAEYAALLTGLNCAKRLGVEKIHAKGDSNLVVCQVLGKWNCNKQHLRMLLQQVVDIRQKFKYFDISHVNRDSNKCADKLANIAMDKKTTDLGVVGSLKTPPISQDEGNNNTPTKDEINLSESCAAETELKNTSTDTGDHDEEELCSLIFSQSTIDDKKESWMSRLPFLAQFEIERFNLRRKLYSGQFGDRLKSIYDSNVGKPSLTRELVSCIYEEEGSGSSAPYDDVLIHCSNNENPVDQGNSCFFLFHAKLSEAGIELLPPEPAGLQTRRIHRKYGSHRFLDLRCDEMCTAKLSSLKKHLNKHLKDHRLALAGRKYGILYSNPSEKKVTFRLFAESGVGIPECDEIQAPLVADRCIPTLLNELSLSKYMKRMKLSFSITTPSLILLPDMLEAIPDIIGDNGKSIMTDGCGLISREALNKVYAQYTYNSEQRNISLGKTDTNRHSEAACPFSSFQGRIGGIKGMFVVDDSLSGVKVQYRPSQLKYDVPMTKQVVDLPLYGDDILHNTVELKTWDKQEPPHAYLSCNTIQLLEERGVPREYFLSLARKQIDELALVRGDYVLLMKKYKARKYIRDSNCLFEDDLLMRMLYAQVPLDEPLMISKVNDFINEEFKLYREKSKFPLAQSCYLRILPDHTGLLECNEAFVALGDEGAQYNIARLGSIIAMRHPSYFVGDLRKLKIVSKAELLQRCPDRGRFFSGIVAGLVLSTRGAMSDAELMSGGDYDGDTAWVCYDEKVVDSVGDYPGQNTQSYTTGKDPFAERNMAYTQPEWTDLIINYTMHHRNDKNRLGRLSKTLEMMRDSSVFSPNEINEIAKKAFIQVDNPHATQWTESDDMKYGCLPKPHWFASAKSKTYKSKKVLGELFDMFEQAEERHVNNPQDIEAEMNTHIREQVEKAYEKNPEEVEKIRKDMLCRLKSCNKAMYNRIDSVDQEDEVERSWKNRAIIGLYRKHRVEIENSYEEEELPKVFAILYEQTYFKSRERMQRWNGKPYAFAWGVGHDYLTRIIADGEAKKHGNGIGIAPTVARGNAQLIFGKRR